MSKLAKIEPQRETSYRIEERYVADGTVDHSWSLTGPDAADEAWHLFDTRVVKHRHAYTPHSPRRLVLLAVGGAK